RSERRPARTPTPTSRPTCRRSGWKRLARSPNGCGCRRTRRSRRWASGRNGWRRSPIASCCAGRERNTAMHQDVSAGSLLSTIDVPAALRRLDRASLAQLARELRAFVLESVSRTGGHLSSNLGTVELAIALHYVFDTPRDRLIWA